MAKKNTANRMLVKDMTDDYLSNVRAILGSSSASVVENERNERKKKASQCLLIQTTDGRKFLTHEKNYEQLIEFANTFQCEVFLVKLTKGRVLDLPMLAAAISDPSYNETGIFEVVQTRIGRGPIGNKNMNASREIKKYVEQLFLEGKVVDFKELMKQFSEQKLTYNAVALHAYKARQRLKEKGITVAKVTPGRYRVVGKTKGQLDEINFL